jgi:hypothetical protein
MKLLANYLSEKSIGEQAKSILSSFKPREALKTKKSPDFKSLIFFDFCLKFTEPEVLFPEKTKF